MKAEGDCIIDEVAMVSFIGDKLDHKATHDDDVTDAGQEYNTEDISMLMTNEYVTNLLCELSDRTLLLAKQTQSLSLTSGIQEKQITLDQGHIFEPGDTLETEVTVTAVTKNVDSKMMTQ